MSQIDKLSSITDSNHGFDGARFLAQAEDYHLISNLGLQAWREIKENYEFEVAEVEGRC